MKLYLVLLAVMYLIALSTQNDLLDLSLPSHLAAGATASSGGAAGTQNALEKCIHE